MKVNLPVTRIEEVEIPNDVFRQWITQHFQRKYPRFDFDCWIDDDGYIRRHGYYFKEKATLEDIAIYNFWCELRAFMQDCE